MTTSIPRSETKSLFSNVLVAIDDSEVSLEAIDAVAASVKAVNGALTVVFVRHRPVIFDSDGVDSASAWDVVEESLKETEHDAHRDVADRLKENGLSATFVTREGDPGREILAVAQEHDVSAVVIGSAIHGTIGSILLSSVTEYLVHHCKRPLVIVRPNS